MTTSVTYEDLGYAMHEIRSQRLELVGVIDTLNTIDSEIFHGRVDLEEIIAQITNNMEQLACLHDTLQTTQHALSQQPRGGGGL